MMWLLEPTKNHGPFQFQGCLCGIWKDKVPRWHNLGTDDGAHISRRISLEEAARYILMGYPLY